MKLSGLGALLAAAAALARASQGETPPISAKDLEGTWTGMRFTEGRGDDPSKGAKVEFTFKGELLAGRKESGSLIGEATFTIDGRNLDATGTTGGYRGKTYLGIFKLEGDTLTWCVSGVAGRNARRPRDFAADPGTSQYLIVLRRRKP
jgi:uncharacterized protein (TIGR03067 family)